ncbi:MAG: GNAT family acetyltransferase [Herpetosiphonaceae bacterium]|nr:GNAT family acetyltransferase [Herpetosiphonaceae bacterium]
MTDPQLLIRLYQPADEVQVIDLWQRCGLTVPWNDPQQDIQRKVVFQPSLFWVGVIDGRIVGTLMAGYEGRRGWINYLGVAPEYRRIGIGRQWMATAEAALQELGCPKINLQVRSSNTSVIAFYRSLGFTMDEVVSLGKHL